MKVHIRSVLLLTIAAALLLIGCSSPAGNISTEPSPAPTAPRIAAEPAPTVPETVPPTVQETVPMEVVPEAGDYQVKIYTINPEETVVIPDESVPLAPSDATLPPAGSPVTKRQAEAIAIHAAGLTQDDVSFLFTKEDKEDGIAIFEVNFRNGFMEYEFEIAADTGEILTFEKEDVRDD